MPNYLSDYFKKGFSLANKSMGVFFFGLSLSLLGGIPDLLGNSFIKGVLQLAGFLLTLIGFGFYNSLPAFLVEKQQGKPLSFGNILSVTVRNTKRLALPSMLMAFCLVLVGILSFILIARFIYGGSFDFLQNLSLGFNIWGLLFCLLTGLLSLITFTPIYFSLEGNGLFRSMKKSVNFSFKHLDFVTIVFLVSAIIFLLSVSLSRLLSNQYAILLIGSMLYEYEMLLLSAASLILYQKHAGGTTVLSSLKEISVVTQTAEEKYKKFLAPDEKVIKVFDYANSQFIWDLIIGILLTPLLFLGLILISIAIYRKLTLKYLVTNRRVIVKKGLIGQSTVSADYSKITDVAIQQGVMGRLILHTGTMTLNTAGTDLGEITIKWVENPFKAKDVIYEQLHKK